MNDQSHIYVYYVEGLGNYYNIYANSQENAKRILWNHLTEEQRNNVESIDIVEIED